MTHHISAPQGVHAPISRKRLHTKPGNAVRAMATLAVLAPALITAGCATHSDRHFVVGSTNTTYEQRHAIEIDEKEQILDIPVATNSYALDHASKGAIEGFLQRYRQARSGSVTVMLPSGSPNEQAARTVANIISNNAINGGIPQSRIQMVTYHAAEHGSSAPIRLSYSAVNASVSGCGQWDEDLVAPNGENRNYRNFGCASQSNLAASIANPTDLLNPRGMTPIDAQRRGQVIDTYRAGEVIVAPPAATNF